jgi:hypothetical protein
VNGDILPAIVGIVFVAAAAAFALLPFVRGTSTLEASSTSAESTADRYGLYRQVLELEFDYQVGKLSSADFEQLSRELLAQAGSSLRQERGSFEAIDEEIEREVAAARAAFAAARRSGRTEAETIS